MVVFSSFFETFTYQAANTFLDLLYLQCPNLKYSQRSVIRIALFITWHLLTPRIKSIVTTLVEENTLGS